MKLNNRLVIIVGPSTTGKTTLSKKISAEFPEKSIIISHDEVLARINKNQAQDAINLQFRLRFIEQITRAISDSSNKLIILDTLNFNSQALSAVLYTIRIFIKYTDGITLIKMNLPLELHKEYIIRRSQDNKLVNPSTILSQREFYNSPKGSLYVSYDGLVNEEIMVENPQDLTLDFDIKRKVK